VDRLAWSLANWGLLDTEPDATIRVLPARAMPKAYRQSFADAGASDDETAAAVERLNDANYDAFVAMVDGQPAGRVAYLEVGDFARLAELFVAPARRGQGVGRCLTRHVLQLARRLAPRAFVAAVPAEDDIGARFLQRVGFSPTEQSTQFIRPA
jgi:GNAT superfamily N-acetyltransferase